MLVRNDPNASIQAFRIAGDLDACSPCDSRFSRSPSSNLEAKLLAALSATFHHTVTDITASPATLRTGDRCILNCLSTISRTLQTQNTPVDCIELGCGPTISHDSHTQPATLARLLAMEFADTPFSLTVSDLLPTSILHKDHAAGTLYTIAANGHVSAQFIHFSLA